jgi:hypothetical protein
MGVRARHPAGDGQKPAMTCRPKPQFASSIPVSRRSGPAEHRPSQYLPSRRYSRGLAGQADDVLLATARFRDRSIGYKEGSGMPEATKDELRVFLGWTVALQRAMDSAVRYDNADSIWKYGGFRNFAHKYSQILQAVRQKVTLPPILDEYIMANIRGVADTIVPQQKEIFDSVYANVSVLRATIEGMIGLVEDKTTALNDFLYARLRSAMHEVPEQERDVQNAIEDLLIGRGLQKGQDYDREVGRVKISAKEVVPDFVFPPLSLALEVKLIKTPDRVRKVIDEINADTVAYSTRYRQITFVVYDLGHIRDETEFRRDLESAGTVIVIIVKH